VTRALLHQRRQRDRRRNGSGKRWHTITINRDLDEGGPGGRLPQPLADLTDVDVQLRRAPGSRGTEIAVRDEQDDCVRPVFLPH
jgi:hypothetical protein